MAGLGAWMPLREGKVQIIASVCDMILFSRTPEEDMAALIRAVEDGTIPPPGVAAGGFIPVWGPTGPQSGMSPAWGASITMFCCEGGGADLVCAPEPVSLT